jgi:leucine dehydrogenase
MMSKKTLIAGLPFGGGKGVINGTPDEIRTPKLLKAYAQVVDSLGGRFYTGEDVGLQETDIQYMLTFSPYFVGKTGQAGRHTS